MGNKRFQSTRSAAAALVTGGPQVEMGIACDADKQQWLDWASSEFSKTSDGKHIKVNFIPMSFLDSAHALLNGDQRINVWSPASAAYKDVFVREWQLKYNQNPILREESLAATPMVFVMWDERYQAFIQKYQTVSFDTINQALQARGGWDEIAQRPDWGLFKFGHTHPSQSNSGLMSLVLAAYAYHHKTKDLALKDVLNPGFQKWQEQLERGTSGLSNSTDSLMQQMMVEGPSAYDAILIYENLAIESLRESDKPWGKLRLVYPEYNAWNDNPYFIINAPWSNEDQRKAADAFLNFLLTQPVQREALKYGFRPASADVSVKFPGSPFLQYEDNGVRVTVQKVCDPPKPDVVKNLLALWQRSQGNR